MAPTVRIRPRLLALCLFLIFGQQSSAQNISEGLNAFSVDLLTRTVEFNEGTNIAISPFTVWKLLAVVNEGARGNTARQLESTLRIPGDKQAFRKNFTDFNSRIMKSDPDLRLDLSDAIFTTTDQRLKSEFSEISQKTYGVDVRPTDFKNTQKASENINSFISKSTNNQIKNLVTPDDLIDAQIFMTSAMHFKGNWQMPFNRSLTTKVAFYNEKKVKIGDVDMMYRMGFYAFARIDALSCLAIEIPYGQAEKMSLVVLLPYKEETVLNMLRLMSKYSLREVLQTLDKAKDEYAEEDVLLYLPKFTVNSEYVLNSALDKMGVKDVFNSQTADLLGIFPHYLYISKILQKAQIEVNEEGTEAAVATGASFQYKAPPPKFEANRPFAYFIVDKATRSVVFAGTFMKPS